MIVAKKKLIKEIAESLSGCKRVLVPGAVIEAGTILPVRVVRSTGMTLIARKE